MEIKTPTNKIRFRFAPSPTGFLHVGSLRTVLFGYLAAKSLGGKFILRIEDTDRKREVAGAVEGLIDILDWVGLSFDEGPHVGGGYGPYVQSERQEIYDKYAKELLDRGGAYRCFCTPERLEQMRKDQQANKLPPRYDRHCRELDNTKIKSLLKANTPYVIRQKMPLQGEVKVHDELRGEIIFRAVELDDHVLIKTDGIPTYQFAVVVDDHLMEISHVLRGEEWIPSFPKNILLYQAFNWEAPKFIHTALTLNKGGGKLSKRQGDVAVEDYKAKGYLRDAILNFCVLLGWHPKDEQEILNLDEMIQKFNYQDMGISPAVFDLEKLDYLNGYYIRHLDLDELTSQCVPYFISADYIFPCEASGRYINRFNGNKLDKNYLMSLVGLEQERLKKISDITEATEFFFNDNLEYAWELLIWKKMTNLDAINNLTIIKDLLTKIPLVNWTQSTIQEALISHIEAKGLRVGEFLWPLRVALTGRKASPGPCEVAEVLGQETVIKRLEQSISLIPHQNL
jgi:glutamyl-tRNA synthetase